MFTQKALQLWEALIPSELDNASQTLDWMLLMYKGVRGKLLIFLRSDMQTHNAGESVASVGHVAMSW